MQVFLRLEKVMTTKTKNKSWYEIKAQDNAAHITIHGVIGDWGSRLKTLKKS